MRSSDWSADVCSSDLVWLADRKVRLADGLARLGRAARSGTIPKGSIEDGTLRIDRLTADAPDGIEDLVLDLYRRLPPVRITDLLLEVDTALGFTDAFTHLRTGVPCGDRRSEENTSELQSLMRISYAVLC